MRGKLIGMGNNKSSDNDEIQRSRVDLMLASLSHLYSELDSISISTNGPSPSFLLYYLTTI